MTQIKSSLPVLRYLSILFLLSGLFIWAGCSSGPQEAPSYDGFTDSDQKESVSLDRPQPTNKEQWPKTHTVKEGQTLWKISKQYYGTGDHWREIYNQNLEKCKNPRDIKKGTELAIPRVETTGESVPK